MTTTADIAVGLAAAITDHTGLRAFDYLPAAPPTPCAVVGVDLIRFHDTAQLGNPTHRMVVTVLVRQTSDRAAQQTLYAHMAPSGQLSIREAIEADTTLNGVVDTLVVEEVRNMRQVSIGDGGFLAIDYAVRVHP